MHLIAASVNNLLVFLPARRVENTFCFHRSSSGEFEKLFAKILERHLADNCFLFFIIKLVTKSSTKLESSIGVVNAARMTISSLQTIRYGQVAGI